MNEQQEQKSNQEGELKETQEGRSFVQCPNCGEAYEDEGKGVECPKCGLCLTC